MPPKKKTGYDAVHNYLAQNYGLSQAIIDSDTTDPTKGFTISEALAQINKEGLAANAAGYERAANILAKTNWFQTYGVDITTKLSQEKTAKGVFARNVTNTMADIKAQATALGYAIPADELKNIARHAYVFGEAFNSNVTIQNIVNNGSIVGGAALNTINDLKTHAANMGIQHDDNWYTTAAQSIAENKTSSEQWKQQINTVAKSKYANFADQIDAGQNVKALASPYINSMSNILEIPAANISLSDPTVHKALTSLDGNSKPALQPLWQFENSLRQDPRWAQTKNARDTADTTTRQILSDFGLGY